MIADSQLALFLMLGQSAERAVRADPQLVPAQTLPISPSIDIAESLPEVVSAANQAAEAYRLFFVFEAYLRELIVEVLSNDPAVPWWTRSPPTSARILGTWKRRRRPRAGWLSERGTSLRS